MDTKKEDTDVKTEPEAPAMPAPGEPGPAPSAVPWEPLHWPVDVAEDSLEGLQSAFRALSVEEVDTQPVRRKREREKDAGDKTDKGADQGHDPRNDPTFEGAPSTSGLHASPSPITTTLPTPDPAAATSTTITNPPMAFLHLTAPADGWPGRGERLLRGNFFWEMGGSPVIVQSRNEYRSAKCCDSLALSLRDVATP